MLYFLGNKISPSTSCFLSKNVSSYLTVLWLAGNTLEYQVGPKFFFKVFHVLIMHEGTDIVKLWVMEIGR